MPESLTRSPARAKDTPKFSRFGDLALRVIIVFALLIPIVWQSRIHAGDLSSHIYNAWLAGEIKNGAVQDITLAPMWTNVLTDWVLERLVATVGASAAQRMVVASAVLVFFWGAFFFMESASGRRPWLFCPILGVLSYGLVFHLGFLNFYLSTGFSFWILGLLWRPTRRRILIALPLAALAILAHALPLVWAFSVLAYLYMARLLPGIWKLLMPMVGLGALLLIRIVVMSRYLSRWSWDQVAGASGFTGITGLDQVWLYDNKYLIITGVLFLLWAALFLERLDQGEFFTDAKVQIWFLHMAAFVLMPSAIQLPQYQHALAFIPQRISMLIAITFCIMVGGARYGRGITRLSGLVAAIFFIFLNMDDRAFNRAEDEVTRLIAALPPGQRVVAAIDDKGSRVNAMIHVADRACIGRCFSYGDYEPATAQFRIRVAGPNAVVASNMTVVREIEEGEHIVTPSEAPLYSICPCEKDGNRFCVRMLHAGEQTCAYSLPISPRFWGVSSEDASVRGSLAGKDQSQVPDHQRRVPIVDQTDHLVSTAPNAKSAQDQRY